jgi:hypothetical protein
MAIIEVNFAGFQFTRCVPDVPGGTDRHSWHVSRMRLVRRWAPRLRAA